MLQMYRKDLNEKILFAITYLKYQKNPIRNKFSLRFEKQIIENPGKIKLKFSLPNPKYIIIFVTDFLTDA